MQILKGNKFDTCYSADEIEISMLNEISET